MLNPERVPSCSSELFEVSLTQNKWDKNLVVNVRVGSEMTRFPLDYDVGTHKLDKWQWWRYLVLWLFLPAEKFKSPLSPNEHSLGVLILTEAFSYLIKGDSSKDIVIEWAPCALCKFTEKQCG